MAVMLYDATIQGSLIITAGTAMLVSVDFNEVNAQTFSISSGTATLYNSSGTAVSSALTDLSVTTSVGIRSSKRVSVTINAQDTESVSAGQYYFIWVLTLGDGQTRKVKQAIQVRSVT